MLLLVENLSLKNPVQDVLSSLIAVISTNESSTQIITGHVIYNPADTYKFQLKTTEGKIHLWLERIAEKLDNPNANVDDWLLLRQILLKIMKMENNSSMQKEIFNSVFDPMRAKAWSKMHFKTRYSNHEIFCQTLYAKVFPMEGNPLSQEYKKVFDEISTESYIHEKFQMNSSKKQESQLDLSRKCSKFHSNFHEMLYQAVDLRRDIGRFKSMDGKLTVFNCIYFPLTLGNSL